MRFLVTSIGSMAAECVIKQLKKARHFVVGCDIYPGKWHYETMLCDTFYQAPFATNEYDYVIFLLSVSKEQKIDYIIPLTDLEIDVLDRYRNRFDEAGIVLCMQSTDVLKIVRNKKTLNDKFLYDDNVPSIRTCLLLDIPDDFPFPCIAKPINGRSSEGLILNATNKRLQLIENKEMYIIQEQLEGNIFTVDYVRNAISFHDAAIPRQELLRTKNGAGLTIQTSSDNSLLQLVSYIGNVLNINGCVNMEFIYNHGKYYLIDINPRFSAGVAFSVVSGYNMVLNHIRCFIGEEIDKMIEFPERIIIKKYEEVII